MRVNCAHMSITVNCVVVFMQIIISTVSAAI